MLKNANIESIFFFIIPFISVFHHKVSGTLFGKITFIIIIIFFFLIVTRYLLLNESFKSIIFQNNNKIILLFFVWILVSLVRSANSGALPLNYMITIFLKHTIFGFSIILFSSLIIFFSGFKNYYRLIIYSGYLLILINFILHTIGIEAIPKNIIVGDYGNASVLELFNIYTKRVLFYLAPGLQSYGIFVGTYFIISVGKLKYSSDTKVMSLLMCVICLYSLILTDVRGSIFFAFLILLSMVFYDKKLIKYFSSYILLLTLFTFIVLTFSSIIYYNYQTYFEGLSRTTDSLVSYREIIWLLAIQFILKNPLDFIFGYGFMGHYISGVSENYSFLFMNWREPLKASLHNTYLQMIYDCGMIGFSLLVIIIKKVTKKLSSESNKNEFSKIMLWALGYLIISGLTDGSILISNYIAFYLFLMISVPLMNDKINLEK